MSTLVSAFKARGLAPDPAQTAVLAQLETLRIDVDAWAKGRSRGWLGFGRRAPQPRGLYIHGPVGRGKSLLMDVFFAAAGTSSKRRVHFHAFMQEMHAAIKAARASDPGDPIGKIAKTEARAAQLLCFDEFHVTDIADAMLLGRLFEALFAEGVVVVATSNRAPEALYEGGINRQLFLPFIAMLKAQLDVVRLDGPRDYRLDRLSGARSFITPLGAEADAEIERVWAELTDHEPGRAMNLPVAGRILTLNRTAHGVVRAPFDDLCEAPLGPADFLAIAETFDTVMLEHVPVLGPERRNAAKRFVTLIDALYEARARLICSAAAPPHALYREGDGSFEFQRTVSRLTEMQSEAYQGQGRRALAHAPGVVPG